LLGAAAGWSSHNAADQKFTRQVNMLEINPGGASHKDGGPMSAVSRQATGMWVREAAPRKSLALRICKKGPNFIASAREKRYFRPDIEKGGALRFCP